MKTTTIVAELVNQVDLILHRLLVTTGEEIRRITIEMMVKSRTYPLCISEEIAAALHLPIVGKKTVQNVDGSLIELDVANNIQITVNNHSYTCRALVLKGNSKPIISTTMVDYLTLPFIRI